MTPPVPPNSYQHLRLGRETPLTERYRQPDRRKRFKPDDRIAFGQALATKFGEAKASAIDEVGGYDDRRLLKIILRPGEPLPDFSLIPGIEVVSQENRSIVLAFATSGGMTQFESRLATLAQNGTATRAQILYAIEDFSHWTADDRTGNALRSEGFPDSERFIIDVELWPQERVDRRTFMVDGFRTWLGSEGIVLLDTLLHASLVMFKVRCTREQAELRLLHHRDVRTVDLPPSFGLGPGILRTDLTEVTPPLPPADAAPGVTVLDSGLTTAHPLISVAAGDAQGFVAPDRAPADMVPHGHGTSVAGLALYGDVSASLQTRSFVPVLRLFSGKVFNDDGTNDTGFVERAVEEAVEYFQTEYGCRVFNLSYGDLNKVYDGRHLRGLAYTLDRLSRTRNILFVTSAGNRTLRSLPANPKDKFPDYLFEPEGKLLDPGTALNALTVGGLARHNVSPLAQRYPTTLEEVPIAQHDQPSPITRCGPSIGDAIKPDFVEYAGNIAVDRQGGLRTNGLGVVSLNSGFAADASFREDIGTSYAAPLVAHKAARLLVDLPDASPPLLRALLGIHAKWPDASAALLNPANNAEGRERLLRAVGYGRINEEALYRSLDHAVTLVAEERIAVDQHHFFEVPLPVDWLSGNRRSRTVSVSLAYAPEVRTTRIDYRATKLKFSLVNANDLNTVANAFRRDRDAGMSERSSNRWISSEARNCGTLQVSRWSFHGNIEKSGLFVVVTRQDATWSPVTDQPENYAVAIMLEDRERAEGNLYLEVRGVLQARARARIQT